MTKFTIVQSDITIQKVDAIVNAANKSLLGGGGVDGAIHQAAGPKLLEECKTLSGCQTGQAKITRGYNLPAKYVIHTVGPIYGRENSKEAELLSNCYKNSLMLAKKNKNKTIAFPAISCGIYGYPINQAAKVAIKTVKEYIKQDGWFDEIRFVLFSPSDKQVYQTLTANS